MTTAPHMHPPIPSLPGLPLLGNIFALRNQRLELLLRISREFGDIGAFHFGTRIVPLLNAPALVRSALIEQGASFEKTTTVRSLARPVLGNGVFLSEGDEHRTQRRVLTPLFQHSRILNYTETIIRHITHLQAAWREGEVIDLATEMTHLTQWIISEVLFGADIAGEERALGEALNVTFRYFADAMTNPLRLPLKWPTPGNYRVQRALSRVNTTLYRMMQERQQSMQGQNDLLSTLLHTRDEGNPLPHDVQGIRDNALSLFVAGHETTATALTWCWYLLSQHPAIYRRMQDEVDQVLKGRQPTISDLPNLPYTLQVFKETLRLYPPVYAFTRRARVPLLVEGYHIARGTSVVISPYTLQRRANLFPDPEKFDPDRFAAERERDLVRYSYLPFGVGSHICLGMPFALLEGHLILAVLTQRLTFEFAGAAPIEPEPLLTLRPGGPVLMRVRKR